MAKNTMENSERSYQSFDFKLEGLEGLRQFSETIEGIDGKINYLEKCKFDNSIS